MTLAAVGLLQWPIQQLAQNVVTSAGQTLVESDELRVAAVI